MPVERGKDKEGPFYRWGTGGAKKHYESGNADSRGQAQAAAERQGRAFKASQTRRLNRKRSP